MKIGKGMLLLGVLLAAGIIGCRAVNGGAADNVRRMPPEELKAHLDDPDFVIIDVRTARDWDGSPAKIRGAIREPADRVSDRAVAYSKDRTIVLYCA